MDAKLLGEKIAELRKAKGMTQKQLAESLHVTDGAVSKWERGINYPDLSILESVAKALDTNLLVLLSLEDSTKDQVVQTLSELSLQEKRQLVHELRVRGCVKLVIECMIAAAMLAAGRIFHEHGIYGFAQRITVGMVGFVGSLIGSEIYSLKNLPKLRS